MILLGGIYPRSPIVSEPVTYFSGEKSLVHSSILVTLGVGGSTLSPTEQKATTSQEILVPFKSLNTRFGGFFTLSIKLLCLKLKLLYVAQ